MDELESALAELRAHASPARLEGLKRVAIPTEHALGVSIPEIRSVSRNYRRRHDLALRLWDTGIHEARMLAAMVDDQEQVSPEQMERWVADFDAWDVCDGVCDLFIATPWSWEKSRAWCERDEEFVRRAGFVLIARMAVRSKSEPDAPFLASLDLIRRHADDDRNFVKKAVNWALRQVGKRNRALNEAAIACAEQIRADGTRSGRWIANDALRELRGDAVQSRLHQ